MSDEVVVQVELDSIPDLPWDLGCGDDIAALPVTDDADGVSPSTAVANKRNNKQKQKKRRRSPVYEHWSHCYRSVAEFPRYDLPEAEESVVEPFDACILQGNSSASGVGVISLKYWRQRHLLFSRFNEGVQMDSESFYSVTPEAIAEHIAERCQAGVVIDAFAGAGGNAIAFARYCSMVIAIDIDPVRIAMAKHNAKVYGVEDRIEFIMGDFLELAPKLKADVVFLSPPWGGPNYLQSDVFDVSSDIVCNGFRIFDAARKITSNIAYFLPRNVNILQAVSLAGFGNNCEIETNYQDESPKTITAYYGALITVEPNVSAGYPEDASF